MPEVEKKSALNITLYDITGASLNPKYVKELVAVAEQIAQAELNLAITVVEE